MTFVGEYRRDGWPLCPRCGGDALRSTRDVKKKRPRSWRGLPPKAPTARDPRPTDEMRCGNCHWNGCLPSKAEYARWFARGATR